MLGTLKYQRIFQRSILLAISLSTVYILSSCSQRLNERDTYITLGYAYLNQGKYQEAIVSFKEAIRINPDDAYAYHFLGQAYSDQGQYQEAIVFYKEAIRINPGFAGAYNNLGVAYFEQGHYQKAYDSYKKALQHDPEMNEAHFNLGEVEAILNTKGADTLARERFRLEEERKRLESHRLAEENRRQQPPEEKLPQSGTGSGFFISKIGHVITNAHVVKDCNRVTVGDSANKQVPAKVIRTDPRNDLALLKLSTLEMASAESKALIQKLNIAVMPLATNGLLRSEDVRLGEKVLVAGYPFGDFISNTVKVTGGIVSATLGAGDDSGQFQLDAAIQPGNSGGPIYDYGGNIVGVVVSQLNKLRMAEAIGTIPENLNFGIKTSTVRQFLESSGLPSKKVKRTKDIPSDEVAQIAGNQALMVICFQ